jgi:integrase
MEDDVLKLKYLTGAVGEYKFRRTIPVRYRDLAGKQNWVDSLRGMSHAEIRAAHPLFIVRTNAELLALKKRAEASNSKVSVDPPTTLPLFSKSDAEYVAYLYFKANDERNVERGDYISVEAGEGLYDLLSEAAEDHRAAKAGAAGIEVSGAERSALLALISNGMLPESLIPKERTRKRTKSDPPVVPTELLEDQNFRYLSRLIERADMELTSRRLRSLQSGAVAPINDDFFRAQPVQPVATPVGRPAVPNKTIGELINAYREEKLKFLSGSREKDFNLPSRLLSEELGNNLKLSEINREQFKSLVDLLPRIPSYAAQRYPKLKLRDAAAAFELEAGQSADRFDGASDDLAAIRLMFDYATEQEWVTDNLALKVKINKPPRSLRKHQMKDTSYVPYSDNELVRIFNAPLYTGCKDDRNGYKTPGPKIIRRSRYWGPLIALFTGARLGEVLQLERADVSEIDGIPYIQITDEVLEGNEDKRLKTVNAVRDVPMHPELIRIGFLDWVQNRASGRLFPEATPGAAEKASDKYSKSYRTFLKSLGIWVPRRKVFHSFRGNFTDALIVSVPDGRMREAIMGWEPQVAMERRYGRGPKIKMLSEYIKKLHYDGLDLSHLYPKKKANAQN